MDIASLTKLMSVVVALDTFDLDESITVSTDNIPQDLDWKLGLKDGDVITVENILKAMLISSTMMLLMYLKCISIWRI